MRILVTACPFFGHVNTVLPFAVAAHRAGHEVVFATGPDFVQLAARRGLTVWDVGPSSVAAGMPDSLDFFWHTGHQRVADLLPLVDAWRPDLVVSEELELAGAAVAGRLGAEFVVHGLGIAATGEGGSGAFTPELDAFGEQWDVARLSRIYSSVPYISVCPPALRPPATADRVLFALRHSVGQADEGFILPAVLDELPYGRTVHLTLGTVFHDLRPAVLETAVHALRTLPVNLVVTVGPGVEPARFGQMSPQVVIEHYLPHASLLPLCDLVVSHGGAGIVLGALAHGLPQLVVPQAADQFANAAAVHRAGVGLMIDTSEVTGATIAAAAERLLHEPSFTKAAAAVRREMAEMSSAAEVVTAITRRMQGLTSGAGSGE